MKAVVEPSLIKNNNFLKELSNALSSITDIDKFVDAITKTALNTLNLSNGCIHLFSPGQEYAILNEKVKILESQLCIPLVSQENLVGTFVMDSKPNGSPFTPTELKFISDLADLIAITISLALNVQRQFEEGSVQRYLLSSINSGVISISPQKTIVSFNKQAEHILGIQAQDVCGKSVHTLPREINERLLITLQKGEILDKEEVYVLSLNIPMSITTSQIMGSDNQVLGATMLFTDLSSRYHAGYFKAILRDEIRRSKRYGHQFSIVFIHVQNVNRELQSKEVKFNLNVVNQLAEHVRKTIRETDKSIRYSANEIAVLLPEINTKGALSFVQRLTNNFQRMLDQQFLQRITIAVGIASYPSDGPGPEELIQTAITNFYQAMTSSSSNIRTAVPLSYTRE